MSSSSSTSWSSTSVTWSLLCHSDAVGLRFEPLEDPFPAVAPDCSSSGRRSGVGWSPALRSFFFFDSRFFLSRSAGFDDWPWVEGALRDSLAAEEESAPEERPAPVRPDDSLTESSTSSPLSDRLASAGSWARRSVGTASGGAGAARSSAVTASSAASSSSGSPASAAAVSVTPPPPTGRGSNVLTHAESASRTSESAPHAGSLRDPAMAASGASSAAPAAASLRRAASSTAACWKPVRAPWRRNSSAVTSRSASSSCRSASARARDRETRRARAVAAALAAGIPGARRLSRSTKGSGRSTGSPPPAHRMSCATTKAAGTAASSGKARKPAAMKAARDSTPWSMVPARPSI